jgi:hypothetical protein
VSLFLQRQINMMMIPGDSTDPGAKSMRSRIFDLVDTYPGNILSLDAASALVQKVQLLASGSQLVQLPEGYSSTQRLGVLIACDQSFKTVVVSPDFSTSTQLVKAGTNQKALTAWVGTVTSITLTNLSAVTTSQATVVLFQYPEDISDAAAWRSGYQTTGA